MNIIKEEILAKAINNRCKHKIDKKLNYYLRLAILDAMEEYAEQEKKEVKPLTFEQCLREEFLINTQNYPKEYHNLFNKKFNRAKKRFEEDIKKIEK